MWFVNILNKFLTNPVNIYTTKLTKIIKPFSFTPKKYPFTPKTRTLISYDDIILTY